MNLEKIMYGERKAKKVEELRLNLASSFYKGALMSDFAKVYAGKDIAFEVK